MPLSTSKKFGSVNVTFNVVNGSFYFVDVGSHSLVCLATFEMSSCV